MKRILIAALIALVFIPGLVFGADFTKVKLGQIPELITTGVYGTFYGGHTWIFYMGTDPGLSYIKAGYTQAGKLKTEKGYIKMGTSTENYWAPLECCVFKNTLYVFGKVLSDQAAGYTYLKVDSTWSDTLTKIFSSGGYLKDIEVMAAAELNDTLYLFFQTYEESDLINFVFTPDGVNWEGPLTTLYSTYGNISACNYQTPDGEKHLMVGWIDWDYSVDVASFNGTVLFDLHQGIRTDKGKLIHAYAVELNAGTAPSGLNTPGHLEVQMFYGEKAKYYPLKRGIYDFNTKTWHVDDKKLDYTYVQAPVAGAWFCAPSNFKTEGANIRKEVWCTSLYHVPHYWPDTVDHNTYIYALRYRSDLLAIDPDSTMSQEMDTTYRKLWSLIGVLEGPPPYHLNGKQFDPADPPTTFTFGTEQEKGTEITHEYEMSFFEHAGLFGVSAEYRHAVANKHTWDSTFTKGIEYTVSPNPVYNWGYRFFLKPTITRDRFELLDYRGVSTGIHDYFFYVTGGNIQIEPYEMDSVNTHFIVTFENRYPDPQDTICSGEVTWLPTIQSKVNFGTETGYQTTNTSRNTLKLEAGMEKEGIFDVSIGAEGSITFEGTHFSSINRKLGFDVNGPACGAPRPGFPEDVVSYNLRGYWIQARNGVDYNWIPDDYKGCRPWFFTWNVTNIVYQEGSGEDVEEELAASFNLDVTGFSKGFTIKYSLPRTSPVSLKIYGTNGRLVKTLVSGEEAAGDHSINWDGSDERGRALARGVYFARLEYGREQRMQKIVMVR